MNVQFRVMRRSGDKAYILSEITDCDKQLPVVLTASTEEGVHIPSDSFPYCNFNDSVEVGQLLADASRAAKGPATINALQRFRTKNSADVRFFVIVLPWMAIKKWVLEFAAVDDNGEAVETCTKHIDVSSAVWLDRINDFTNQKRANAIESLDGCYIHDRVHVSFIRAVEDGLDILVSALVEMPYYEESVIEFDFLNGRGTPINVDYHVIEDSIDYAVDYGSLDRRYMVVTFLMDRMQPGICLCVRDASGSIASGFAMLGAQSLFELLGKTLEEVTGADEDNSYHIWYENYHRADLPTLLEQVTARFDYAPLMSVVVPVRDNPIHHLYDLTQSLLAQSYGRWELIFVSTNNSNSQEDALISDLVSTTNDDRVFVVKAAEDASFAECIEAGINAAEGEFVAFIRPSNKLASDALFEFVRVINETPDCDLVYCDSDTFDAQDIHSDPTFRPSFSPEYLRSTNYIQDFFAMRSCLFASMEPMSALVSGAFYYDLVLRATEVAREVRHVPRVLCHRRYAMTHLVSNSLDERDIQEAGRRAVVSHCKRMNIKAEVLSLSRPLCYQVRHVLCSTPKVSVIIASQDNAEQLKQCLQVFRNKTHYHNYEIMVLDGGSTQQSTWDAYEQLQHSFSNLRVCSIEDTSNRSRYLNNAVAHATGEYLLFMKDSVRVLTDDALETMLGYFQLNDVGVVGPKRLFVDGTVEHAGLTLGSDGIITPMCRFMPARWEGYLGGACLSHNVSAVTLDCMMICRRLFDEVGGFTEDLSTFYTDVDFCLKVHDAGSYVVFTPHVLLSHFKSVSRQHRYSKELSIQMKQEAALLQARWPRISVEGDYFINPNLDPNSPYYALRW